MIRKNNLFCCGILFLFISIGNVFLNADSYGIDLVGEWEETAVNCTFVRGDRAYVGSDHRFIILDISDKTKPVKLGELPVTESVVDIFISGDYAYVADSYFDLSTWGNSETGLRIIDISTPANPKQVAFIPHRELSGMLYFTIRSIVVSGDYAYVATGNDGALTSYGSLDIINIANPASPELVGRIEDGFYWDVVVYGIHAYCTRYIHTTHGNQNGKLDIINISNPANPVNRSSESFNGSDKLVKNLQLRNGYVYLTHFTNDAGEGKINVVDATDLDNLVLKQVYTTNGTSDDIVISGEFGYIADGNEGLRVIRLNKAYELNEVAYYKTKDTAQSIFVSASYAYVSLGSRGLSILKIQDAVFNKPRIELDKTQLYFGAVAGSSEVTPPQEISIANIGEGTLNWSISTDSTWLEVSPGSGKGDGLILIGVNTNGLLSGTYTGTVTVQDPNASNELQTVNITLSMNKAALISTVTGSFETPLNNFLVMGSIPVTGWALHEVGIESVKIYREPVSGEGDGLIFIGDANFVEGARPDVEAAFPYYPMNSRAGWGYMLLTNFLPGGGNGTFTLHAIATPLSGNRVTLGKKQIRCDNINAVKPFGALDTPAQGGIASGNHYINWGWALTPQPNYIKTSGNTIEIFVDGYWAGNPIYNIYRSDIAELFPGYNNSNGAAGYCILDTTKYSNGIHTIQWVVNDSGQNNDGIGSRYFKIQNSGTTTNRSSMASEGQQKNRSLFKSPANLDDYSLETTCPIIVKKGFKKNQPLNQLFPDKNGYITITIKELERIELSLIGDEENEVSIRGNYVNKANGTSEQKGFMGYLVVGAKLKPLPIGSFLDTERGIFYWGPGAGFVGTYHFMFIDSTQKCFRNINIEIEPKYKTN